ncbi:DUF4129 domain-containing protein [Streptomyces sp. DT24]|uniref:DUF4129 domain-containing protein n=1 Tax=Streptomyces sp. DT24 TaxID=3416520 RepID=UPI003CF51575
MNLTGDDVPIVIPRVPAREAAERELSDPGYHQNDPNLLERGIDRLWDWIGGLLDAASGSAPGGPLGLAVLTLLLIGLAAALWWRLGTPQRTSRTDSALFDSHLRSAAEHRAVAEAHAAAHRWNEAVQECVRGIVRSLEERALLEDGPGRTADEAAAEAGRALPDHATRLRAAAREFDDITYGGRTADRQSYLTLRTLDTDLGNAKPRLTAATGGTAE